MVDTLRLLLAVVVTAAMTDDRQGCVVMLQRSYASGGKCLRKIGGQCRRSRAVAARQGAQPKQTHQATLEVVEHTGKWLQVVKHRWQVEWTWSWLRNDRRQSRPMNSGLPVVRE